MSRQGLSDSHLIYELLEFSFFFGIFVLLHLGEFCRKLLCLLVISGLMVSVNLGGAFRDRAEGSNCDTRWNQHLMVPMILFKNIINTS